MEIFRGISCSVLVLMVVVFAVMLQSATSSVSVDDFKEGEVPSCVATIDSCAKNVTYTNEVESDDENPKAVCCDEWKQVFQTDEDCACKYFGSDIKNSNFSSLYFKQCDIAYPPTCQGAAPLSKNSGRVNKMLSSVGLLPIALLIGTVVANA